MIDGILKYVAIVALIIVLTGCLGNQLSSDPENRKHHVSQNGLLIVNGINRGISYTDSLGSNYSLRYIPCTITNDSTIAIHLHLAFSKKYNYRPRPDASEEFRLIHLPTEWALDGSVVTESMIEQLPKHITNPSLIRTLEPGEKMVIGIGTLYPNPTNFTGILPKTLFVHSDEGIFQKCDWLMKKEPFILIGDKNELELGLRLNFGENCMIVPCGHISYSEG